MKDVNEAIRHALLHPVGDSSPLPELLTRRHEAHDRHRRHLAAAAARWRRRTSANACWSTSSSWRRRKGVEDLELIVATALHRRMTGRRDQAGGGRACVPFVLAARSSPTSTRRRPTRSRTSASRIKGEDVEISKRAAESDLIVYVNINLVAMDGGHKSVAVGLAGYRSLEASPQRRDDAAFTVLHGPARGSQRDQRLRGADGTAARGERRQDLPDRDHAQQRHVPEEPRVPQQA